ncbi:RdgB/HAM1 family non-canonical purine NTP pyrophosphatase [Candidatus Woesearchaeota archaeon]|nr:RdgB/HAM1 family non-canonical purine NTP pyrophosphatase [Candidatus Woesearchaeota archaeon]
MRKLVFLTGNPNKLREAKQILTDYEIIGNDADLPELQEINSELIVTDKIRRGLALLDSEVFVEDVSLSFNALNGLPGPLIKWFLKTVGRRGLVDIISKFEDKTAVAKCMIGYGVPARDGKPEQILVFEGSVRGRIVEPEGESNFGFDPIFLPDEYEKTFAQMTSEEKNSISHRRIALEKFREYLEKH